MVQQAANLGLLEYAVTDHVDFTFPSKEIIDLCTTIPAYVEDVLRVKEAFEGQIKVLLGVELGLRPDCAKIGQEIANAHPFDIIIGSMHDFNGIGFTRKQFYEGKSKHQAYGDYLQNALDTIKACDCFDVLGHLGYMQRYAPYEDKSLDYQEFAGLFDDIIKALIQKGKGMEINTAGFYYGLGSFHPQVEVVKRYFELGGEILTIGSDAHTTANVAQYFDKTYDILKSIGVPHITSFDQRTPKAVAL